MRIYVDRSFEGGSPTPDEGGVNIMLEDGLINELFSVKIVRSAQSTRMVPHKVDQGRQRYSRIDNEGVWVYRGPSVTC